MSELMVNADEVFNVAHALANQAQELREDLDRLSPTNSRTRMLRQ